MATFQDEHLVEREDFFLFPRVDQVLVCFRLESDDNGRVGFIHTDKLGNAIKTFDVDDNTLIVSDFTANVENLFNFDIAIARRVEITGARLMEIAEAIQTAGDEQEIDVSRVRTIG